MVHLCIVSNCYKSPPKIFQSIEKKPHISVVQGPTVFGSVIDVLNDRYKHLGFGIHLSDFKVKMAAFSFKYFELPSRLRNYKLATL